MAWSRAPRAAIRQQRDAITRVLLAGHPHVSLAELTRRLVASGHNIGYGRLRDHEAIAATQAALWHLTDGLDLDTRLLHEPTRAHARIGEHPSGRLAARDADGRLAWTTTLPAGVTAYLELELPGAPQLDAFCFEVGAGTSSARTDVHLERSSDGQRWQPVSGSRVSLGPWRPDARCVRHRLGRGATLWGTSPTGELGHCHYRLAAHGPDDRDGRLDVRDVRVEVAGGPRYRNPHRIVALYHLLLATAAAATLTRPIRQRPQRPHGPKVRVLVGSRTPDGPPSFTPVACVTP